MQAIAGYLRNHAYELSGVALDCKDIAASNRLERLSLQIIEKATLLEKSAPPREA